jgi:hypothetical protein
MMEGLKKLNEEWIGAGEKPLDIGIGINTDIMVVGNMDSEKKLIIRLWGMRSIWIPGWKGPTKIIKQISLSVNLHMNR